MQDLFMYFYQDNCDLNHGNYWWNIIKIIYVIQITIQCVCCMVLIDNFCIR